MTGSRVVFVLLLVGAALLTGTSAARLERMADRTPAGAELLYLPNGRLLKVMSLGNAPLLADAIYVWAIQYYSDYERKDRYLYVDHVFDRVITELDPQFIDAYWLGALILIVEARDLEAGLGLLEKGAERNPDQWILPYLAAWEAYHAGQYERAARYFEQAMRVPGVPRHVRRMHAGMFTKAGDLREAIRLWRELADDPESDPATVAIAGRQVRELQVRLDIQTLQAAIAEFRKKNGRNPLRLEELRAQSYIGQLPRDPEGRVYAYDPREGRVSLPAGRVLGGP